MSGEQAEERTAILKGWDARVNAAGYKCSGHSLSLQGQPFRCPMCIREEQAKFGYELLEKLPDAQSECSRLVSRVEELEKALKLSAARFHSCAKWLSESKSEGWAGEATNWARQVEIDVLGKEK